MVFVGDTVRVLSGARRGDVGRVYQIDDTRSRPILVEMGEFGECKRLSVCSGWYAEEELDRLGGAPAAWEVP